MNHEIIVAGKPSLKYAKDGTAEYLKRLQRYGKYKLTHIKDGSSEDVSKRLFEASKGTVRIVMDERGEIPTTGELVKLYNKWEMRGFKNVSFVVLTLPWGLIFTLFGEFFFFLNKGFVNKKKLINTLSYYFMF